MAKKNSVLTVLTIFLFLLLMGSLPGFDDTKDKIIKASDVLFNPDQSVTQEKILNSLCQLLDIAASITTSEHKVDINYRIEVAKELFKDDSLFNEKARQYLSFAYRMMTNGQKYQSPDELDVFVTPAEAQEKAMKYAAKLRANALSQLDNGNPEEAAKIIVELVLMLVTPMTG